MNENPGETPNPLNPTPAAAPVTPTPVEPAPAAQPAPAAEAPVAPGAPVKKKKTGLIVGIICGILILGCAIAAILFFFVFNKGGNESSSLTDAIVKLINGENKNIAVATEIDFNSGDGLTINAKVSSEFNIADQIGSMTVDLTIPNEGGSIDLNIESRSVDDGNAYVKVSGIKDYLIDMIEQNTGLDCDTDDCSTYLEMMSSSAGSYSDPFSTLMDIDGEWVKIEANDIFGNLFGSMLSVIDIDSISENKDKIVELYKKYPFITSSTENLNISKKKDNLYKLGIDYDKAASFINELGDSITNCVGAESYNCAERRKVTADNLKDAFEISGEFYVEIDNNNNITRLYVASEGSTDVDLAISYPSEVKVEKPTNVTTKDISSLFSIFGGSIYMGGGDIYDYDDDDYDWDWDDDYDYDYDDYDWDWDDEEDEEDEEESAI